MNNFSIDFNRKHLLNIDKAINKARKMYDSCNCCGHLCRINRNINKVGRCRILENLKSIRVASHTLHFGEEPMIVGKNGSGTVFFSNCNLSCVFCQNYQISSKGMGDIVDIETLASYFISLEKQGAHNINLVSATHVIYPILKALKIALENGLSLPIVYNTNGYDTNDLLECLDGIVDIYLPDLKYLFDDKAIKYSRAENYFNVAINAIEIMKSQVGNLVINNDGIAEKGLIIRHLVLPNNQSDTYDILLELKDRGFLETTISLMAQYNPKFRALEFEDINRKISLREYEEIINYAIDLGFENILSQEMESAETYVPDFTREKPFQF